MSDRRRQESIWGINPQDRQWFEFLTAAAGLALSIIAVALAIIYRPETATPYDVLQRCVLSIVTAFGAAGFTSWTILHTKEMLMSLADSIRRRTDEWEEKKKQEGREEGLVEGRAEGRKEGRVEGRVEGRKEGRVEGRAEGRVEERGELLREFTAAQQEGRLDELLESYNRQANGHHNGQEPENHA